MKTEFMENGQGEFKTNIDERNIRLYTENMEDLGFYEPIDFYIMEYGEKIEMIFYSKSCKESFEKLLSNLNENK